ncbi:MULTISPECIES: hypothetical protein [Oxalobacteraceae]|jgi:flagellar basal body-associated protein FliL|uniref:hypothetical protein n=1 Tax=Oxalobacteraceae TaxID=75682 RepID=UPI0010A5529C|nr:MULTISPECIES: hypothetical protein [Oxalobacteraceae]HJV51350.1 hypothetical protein [Noviherbaspirillum sp.]
MPSKRVPDKMLAFVIGIVLLVLVTGFAGVWFYFKQKERLSSEIVYLNVQDVAISRSGHSIRASFAVRTSGADAEWASANKQALEQLMKQALMEVDPQRALAPDGLPTLQASVRAASNASLRTDKVQEVLITDFLVSEGDL